MEVLVVLLIMTGLVLVLLPAVHNKYAADGPLGEMVPITAPKEENRITHPSGFSIIAPPNWLEKDMGSEYVWIRLAPRQYGARRVLSTLTISREGPLDPTGVPKGFKKVTFQGFRAYERMVVMREYLFDDPAISDYDLYVDRDGEGWHVNYSLSTTMTELPEIMREYINTIRFPPNAKKEPE
ncbi:hypothetical protein F1728_00420 [Gimesia benthica]|uniref:Uncharacterized protein n=1 Tax=Gimesia benthica TaxID=2608982 RepID=A0A6I6A576_9PLAN|nr:hypothetical protein [Gimesia benthica]QGQ21256.1 hypothetical protein F1728_00420 [Gimesia benthica]